MSGEFALRTRPSSPSCVAAVVVQVVPESEPGSVGRGRRAPRAATLRESGRGVSPRAATGRSRCRPRSPPSPRSSAARRWPAPRPGTRAPPSCPRPASRSRMGPRRCRRRCCRSGSSRRCPDRLEGIVGPHQGDGSVERGAGESGRRLGGDARAVVRRRCRRPRAGAPRGSTRRACDGSERDGGNCRQEMCHERDAAGGPGRGGRLHAGRPLQLDRLSLRGDNSLLECRLIVVELQLRQVGQVDRKVDRERPRRILHEVEARPPFVEIALQPDDADPRTCRW